MVARNFLGSKSRLFVPDLVGEPKDRSKLRTYTPSNCCKTLMAKDVHFCTQLGFLPRKRSTRFGRSPGECRSALQNSLVVRRIRTWDGTESTLFRTEGRNRNDGVSADRKLRNHRQHAYGCACWHERFDRLVLLPTLAGSKITHPSTHARGSAAQSSLRSMVTTNSPSRRWITGKGIEGPAQCALATTPFRSSKETSTASSWTRFTCLTSTSVPPHTTCG
jgi:hypothetical protein